MAFADLHQGVGVCDVELLDEGALAEVVFDEGGFAGDAVLGQDDVLAEVEQGTGRVQADEAEAACDQDHEM